MSDKTIFDIDETTLEGKLLGVAIFRLMCSGTDKYNAPNKIFATLKSDLQQAEEYWEKIHGKN